MSKEKFLTSLDGNSCKISDKKGNVVANNIVLVLALQQEANTVKKKIENTLNALKLKKNDYVLQRNFNRPKL